MFDSMHAKSGLALLLMPLKLYMRLSVLAGFHSFPPRLALANNSLVIIRAIFPLNIRPLNHNVSSGALMNVPHHASAKFADPRSTRVIFPVDGHAFEFGPFMQASTLCFDVYCVRALGN